jgi:tetratricopeptide (TPR) repeat protein
MPACPSCSAPLDADGVCTACGAMARGAFRGLDLGPPQLADAVARGLDFYRLLGVQPDADQWQLARRYRQLRVLFPDDPSGLAPAPARKLALLEAAGRALTDPALRRVYDELRAGRGAELRTMIQRCAGCTAPIEQHAASCPYCSTPVPAAPAAPNSPPGGGPPAAEPVDYYALIGLTPSHLVAARADGDSEITLRGVLFGGRRGDLEHNRPAAPPGADEVDAAAFARERQVLLAPGPAGGDRETRASEVDIARRILRDERRRTRYDLLWRAFERGTITTSHLEGLLALQEEARAEAGAERGEPQLPGDATGLLQQGLGLLHAGLPSEALEPLIAAVTALPNDAQARAAYARAILAAGDPLDLGAHQLRQLLAQLEACAMLGEPLENTAALAALCRGLLARDAGQPELATTELQQAVREDSRLGPAWRGLAALALARGAYEDALAACRRALALDSDDERALLMMAAACQRAGRRGEAQSAAAQLARLRGTGWTAEDVLREIS